MADGRPQPAPGSVDSVLDGARARYDDSTDLTLGVEEEYQLCDGETLDLTPRYDDVREAAVAAGLESAVAGELIASEIEFRTGKCDSYEQAAAELLDVRQRATDLIRGMDLRCATSGTHPWADYREQQIIDLPYYTRLVERMGWPARRNNTFGLHVHIGVRGADRAIAICDALRPYLPVLHAISASSPFVDGLDSGLASARSMLFSRNFPRASIPPVFGSYQAYEDFARWLAQVGSVESYGQMWWSVRPHAMYGTIELRIFDGQPDVRDSLAMTALSLGLVAHLLERFDAGDPIDQHIPGHLIDENCWRSTRSGLQAELVVLPGTGLRAAADWLGELVASARTAGRSAGLGIDEGLDRVEELLRIGDSASRQRALYEESGCDLRAAFSEVVDTTMTSARARV